jgi:hypothetical protein
MNTQELEALLRELVQAITQVVESGEELSDEFQGLLAQTLDNLVRKIEESKAAPQEQAPGAPSPNASPLQPSMPSSNIEGFAYDDKTGRLLVRFLGKHPDPNGPIYAYENVPQNIFDIFRKGAVPAKTDGKNKWGSWWKGKYPSMGAAMYHMIRAGGYPYRKVA